jgi:biopolymer transport protein TolR
MSFGRLERTPGPQPMSDINMTPLVDVMLVLVVIFISRRRCWPARSGWICRAPRVPRRAPHRSPSRWWWMRRARPFWTTSRFRRQRWPSAAAHRCGPARATEVQLRADAAVPYGRVVEVMGAAHSAGLQRIGFVAEQPAAAR